MNSIDSPPETLSAGRRSRFAGRPGCPGNIRRGLYPL